VTEDRVDRQARIVGADLCLDSIAWGAKGAKIEFEFSTAARNTPTFTAYLKELSKIRFSVSPAPPVAPWKPIKEKAPELLMGS